MACLRPGDFHLILTYKTVRILRLYERHGLNASEEK